MVVINIHHGLLQFRQLPLGVVSAPGIFQIDGLPPQQNPLSSCILEYPVVGKSEKDNFAVLE